MNTQLVDTHCHLYLKEFADDIDQVIERAENEGVQKFYLPAIDSTETNNLLSLESKFPGKCIAMMGLHPCYVKENYKEELSHVESWLSKRSFAAVGEIGLDYYWDRNFDEQQKDAFRTQIRWASHYKLPIVIHSRDSLEDCLQIVKEEQDGSLKGIFHCFSGSYELANEIIATGFYLGIGGVLTYKKSGLPELVSKIPMEAIVLETDAPYLTPVPYRGKRNESSYIRFVASKLAEIKSISVEEVARITTANAQRIFGS
jgi:TatD DNase family protein